MAHHGSVTDPTNIHRFWNWEQATDPATTDPTLVADGQSWLDTTSSPYTLKVRVSGAWVEVGATGSGYTDEQAQDAAAAMIAAGTHTGLTATYDDVGNTISFAVSGGGLSQEQIEDFIGTTLLVAGTGITVTYNDAAGTITIASTVTAYTDEQAQDAVAAMIAAGTHSGVTATYNDASNSLSLAAASGGTASFQWVLDEGSVPALNYKGWLYVPFNCTITAAYVVADQAGDIVIDVWKDSYANFPPTVADSIVSSAKPTLVGAQKYQDTTLTGWNTSLTAGDFITIKVDSAATVTLVTVVLVVTKSS